MQAGRHGAASKKRLFSRIAAAAIMLTAIPASSVAVSATAPYPSYVVDVNNGIMRSQYAYVPEGVYDGLDAGCGSLLEPQDLFIDERDNLYIADSGNHRVVQWSTKDMKAVRVIGDASGPGRLVSPYGIYVTPKEGLIYVADRDRRAVVVFDADGRYVKEYREPRGSLLAAAKRQGYRFEPSKVVVDQWGFLYVTVTGEYRGLAKISPEGDFVGFFGATNTKVTFWDRFYRRWFMSRELARRLMLQKPEAINNITLGADGNLYTVNSESNRKIRPIRRLSPVGTDTLPDLLVGDPFFARALIKQTRTLVDIAVDRDGNFTVLDQGGNRIYQYDYYGNMLAVFGGRMDEGTGWGGVAQGFEQQGLFWAPLSIAQDSTGGIYVLDGKGATITRFTLTHFGRLVHEAVALYNRGRYAEAIKPWQQVIEMDANYRLAYKQIGKALYRAEKYREAMRYYLLCQDQVGYSKSFREYRQAWLRQRFGLVATVIVLAMAVAVLIFYQRRKARRRSLEEGYHV
ncbi:MAG: hypothetical protein ACM3X6_04205 [Patescibacteria group bacterium]